MPTETPDSAPAKPRSRRRWLRWILLAALVLAVLLAVLYRPLGHWAIQRFGANALTAQGLTGTWKTSGSLLTGLSIDEVKLSGNDASTIRSLTMEHAMLDYDLWALRGEGPGSVLRRVEVKNLNAEIDLTRPGVPKPAKPASTKPMQLPAVRLPTVKLEHVNLRVKLKSGAPLQVDDFSLIMDPAKPGIIQVSRLALPSLPEMRNVRGTPEVTATTIRIRDLTLTPDTVVESLLVDIARLQAAEASFALEGHQADMKLKLAGKSGGWFTEIWVDATLEVDNISQDSLVRWGVPSGKMAWRGEKVVLSAKGPVPRPDRLEATLALSGGSFSMPNVDLRSIRLDAGLAGGKLNISQLAAASGSNSITAKANATMPDTWARIGRSKGEVTVSADVPALSELLPPGTAVTGKVKAEAAAAFDNQALVSASTSVDAVDLILSGVPVESVQAQAQLAGQLLKLERAAVRINARNTLSASGQLELTEPRPWSAKWQVDCADLASVPAEVKPGGIWPSSGRVTSSGEATGSLQALKAKDWAALTATLSLDADAVKIRDATLQSLRLRANSAGGTATLDELLLKLDGANQAQASAAVTLTGDELPLKASLDLSLPQAAKLSSWSTTFGGPALTAGSAEVKWQAEGLLKPLRMDGSGSVEVKGLKVDKVPEVLGLQAEIVQSGSEVNATTLAVTAGPWKAAGTAFWDGAHLNIPKLEGWLKNDRLVTLNGRLPLKGATPGEGPLPLDAPLSLQVRVDQLDVAKLAKSLGQEPPVAAKVKADADFKGTLRQLQGTVSVTATEIKPKLKDGPKLQPATVKLNAALASGKLTLNGTALQPPLRTLTLSADMPLDVMTLLKNPGSVNQLPLRAEMRMPESSLAFLPSWVPALSSVKGTAAVDVKVTGTVGKPVFAGSVQARVPEADFDSPSLPSVKDVQLRVRADGKRVTLDDVSVLLAGGRLRINGGADLEQPKDPKLDLRLSAEEVLLVRDETISMRANAAITCRGPLSQAEVAGTVDLVRGRVFKEIEFLPLSLPNQLPPPPPSTQIGKAGAPSLPAPLDKWRFNVIIRSRDPIRLMGNVARGDGVVDLRLTGSGTAPVLVGNVRLEEMWVKLPFSRLNITQGTLSFDAAHPFDPQIDVTGESLTGGRQVTVVVQGRALDPKVRLTSSPPLPEGEIATLLATGVTTSDLSQNSDEAAGRAAFILIQQTYRKLFKKRAVDTADDEPPRLSFEFSLFGNDASRRGISAVYELNPKWRVIGRVAEAGTFRGMLYYLIRFR